MVDTMDNAGGIGLAANQVGELWRIIVLHMPEEENARIYFNPEIIKTEGNREVEEGCLSLPNYRGIVTRSISIKFQSKDSTEHPVRQLPTGPIEHSDPGTTKSRSCAAAHRARPCEPNITPDTRRQPGAESGNVHVTPPVSPKRKLDECTQTSPKETPGGKKHKGGGSAASIGSQISSDVIDLIITNMAGTATSVSIPTISTRVDSSQ